MMIDRRTLTASWETWLSNDNRNRQGPLWLQWVWTLLFCTALALAFTIFGFFVMADDPQAWRRPGLWALWFGRNLVVCLTIGTVIHLMFDGARATFATRERVERWPGWQRTLFFSGVPMLGVLIGWPIGVELAGGNLRRWIGSDEGLRTVTATLLLGVAITFVLHHWFGAKAREIDAERRATEARLKLLQAQIEPHFLFNTLANVASLIDHDAPKAKAMLHAFTDYLRAALANLRSDEGPLAQELALAQHYLSLQHERMGERLRYSIEADAEARQALLPPLLLQPLVENAVLHGVEPAIEGGHVAVRARAEQGRDGRMLVLEVQDDGRGFDAPSRRPPRAGSGVALANIRARLQARYGDAGRLLVQPASPGTLARITLPFETTPSPDA
jgi:signal transduction histidine kinase